MHCICIFPSIEEKMGQLKLVFGQKTNRVSDMISGGRHRHAFGIVCGPSSTLDN